VHILCYWIECVPPLVNSLWRNVSACCLSSLKILGDEPIMQTLVFAVIGTRCAIGTGAGAPPLGPPDPPSPPSPSSPPPALLDEVPPPPWPVPVLLVVIVDVAVVVEVVVRATVVDLILFYSCSCGEGGPLHPGAREVGVYVLVRVISGAQGPLCSLCVLPGLLVSILAGVWWIWSSGSSLSSVVESSAARALDCVISIISKACTSSLKGPK